MRKIIVEKRRRSRALREKYALERQKKALLEAMRMEIVLEIKNNPDIHPRLDKSEQYALAAQYLERMRIERPEVYDNFSSRVGN